MSTLKKDHILGAGGTGLLGGAIGGAIGWFSAGPLGMGLCAAAGGALGAVLGNRAAEAADQREDLGHFQQIFKSMPYYVHGLDWHDYAPAYRYGLETHARHRGQALEQVESQLQGGWEAAAHFGSRLQWTQARPAVAHAWASLEGVQQRGDGAASVAG